MKKKYSAQQREELLLECKNSGLSAAEWCKQNDIPYQTLAYWRQTIKAGQTKDPFVEILDKPTIQHNHLEVRYANAVIRLNLSSEGALRLLLKVLRSLE